MERLSRALVQLTQRDSDTDEDRRLKVFWVPLTFAYAMLCVAVLFVHIDGPGQAAFLGTSMILVASIVAMLWPIVTRRLSRKTVGNFNIYWAICVLLIDWEYSASMQAFRPWTFVVLLMDVCLAFNVPRSQQCVILALVTLHVLVINAEHVLRLGLYEIPLLDDGREQGRLACDCAAPPCGSDLLTLFPLVGSVLLILYGDFMATRDFADGLRSEQGKTVAAVRLSEHVAHLLASYATDDARRVVREEGSALPAALLASYQQLLDNLDSYRGFLPDALLFTAQQSQGGLHDVAGDWAEPLAPGLGQNSPELAVCFTDIQSSTELWESRPQGMYEGLHIHNRVMREAYRSCSGYEVKTIGDAFMVAFPEVLDALRFGLRAQLGLLRQDWPSDLLTHPLCVKLCGADGGPLWGGLRVRIGVQHGPVRVERNPVTGRCDYFGHTVNTAARLEAVLRKGGLVATSCAVLNDIGEAGLQALEHPVLRDMGLRGLKGIREQLRVWALVPRELSQRLSVTAEAEITAEFTPTTSRRSSPASASSRGSSGGSSAQQRPAKKPAAITLRLQRATATCAAARLALQLSEPVAERLPAFAAAAALAADQTQGVVDALVSACAFVTWNASRPCADHAAACRGFLRGPFRAPCHLGAASGSVLKGNVSAGRRGFTTVVGGCVELAAALAEEAERCGDAALAAGATAAAWGDTAFCAQLWESPGCILVVFAVVPSRGDKWQLEDGHEGGDQQQGSWAQAVSGLFRKACAEPPGSDGQLAVRAELLRLPGDAAARLAERIDRGFVRTRPMPALWDADSGGVHAASVARSDSHWLADGN